MDDERLDLSALDPTSDPGRWQNVVDVTLARVDGVLRERERQNDPLTMIAAWMKPLLIAGAVALAILIPIEVALESGNNRANQIDQLVALSTAWADGDSPTGADLIRALSQGAPE